MVAIDKTWIRENPLPAPDPDGNKDTRGVVLVVGGAVEVPGAVLLAGIAALRAGAGKLQIATCHDVAPQLGTAVPEALVASLVQSVSGGIHASSAPDIINRASHVDVLLLGPGMMDQPNVDAIVREVLTEVTKPVIVLDAAALHSLAEIAELVRQHGDRIIVTPHSGEMASMLGVDKKDVDAEPQRFAEQCAQELGVTTVLKGPETFVAAPGETTLCYTAGGIGLATSGSGDTLAGVIAGLAARGTSLIDAACWGVFLHGAAGNSLAKRVGRVGYLARELLDEIPRVMAKASG